MARLITTSTTAKDGRFALLDEGKIIGYGHLELPFIPPGSDGSILNGLQFVLEPRNQDTANERMMLDAHGAH